MESRDFVHKARTLPERFADRLTERDLNVVAGARDGGEWEEEIENLVLALAQTGGSVSAEEQQELRMLLEHLEMPTQAVEGLKVTS